MTAANILTALLVNSAMFAVLFGLMLIIRKLMAKKISAVLQYMLWALVVIKLVVPFGFESALSPFGLLAAADSASPVITQTDGTGQALPADNTIYTGSAQPETASSADTAIEDTGAAALQNPSDSTEVKIAGTVKPIDWAAAVIGVWAAGILAAATLMALDARKLRRGVRREKNAPSARVIRVFEECKRELGVQRHVDAVTQSAVNVPLAMGAFRPVLVFPEDIDAADNERIRHVCLHELAHIKYGDLAVICIMNVLCSLYWFNPFVWLCFRFVRKDMETACDARVLHRLGSGSRQGYIGTVLQYAARGYKQQLYAGFRKRREAFWSEKAAMGMADGRLPMEQRVRGMFRKPRTGLNCRVIAISVAVLMLAACALTACQPTPEKPVVINKGDGKLANEINATPAPKEKYQAPAQCKLEAQSFYDGMLSVSFDMQVETPDVSAYPVYTVQDADLTQQQVDRIVSALMQDKPLKYYDERDTKQELTEKFLLPAKQKLSEAKNGKEFSDDGGNISVEQLQDNVEMFENWILNAPETKDEHSITAEDYTTSGSLSAMADLGKSRPATLIIARAGQTFYYVQFINGTEYIYNGFSEPAGDLPLKTTKEQAVAIATQLISDMGAEDFRLAAVGKTTRLGSENDIDSEEYQNTMAYSIVFTRTVDGIPLTYTPNDSVSPSIQDKDAKMDAERWSYERIMVNIDDDGVANVFWNGNLEVGACVNENVRLIKFEDIASRAIDQIKIQHAYLTDQGKEGEGLQTKRLEFDINKAKLGFARIRVKDSVEYQIVPVWDFYGSTTYYRDENEIKAFNKKHGTDFKATEVYNNGYRAIVTINAIDGSVIDRNLGY